MAQHLGIQPLLVIFDGNRIDRIDIQRRDDRFLADIAEQRDLAPFILADGHFRPAEQHVGLNTDRQQFLNRMLGRLGLQLAGGADIGQQRDMQEHHPLAPHLVAELADRLQEGQAFDIADRAADLADDEILAIHVSADEFLDRVGNVRDHLHGGAQIIAAPLALDHGRIDSAGRHIVAAARGNAGETLIMAEVEIGFGTIVGDENLAMLQRAHRAGIDVQIGV